MAAANRAQERKAGIPQQIDVLKAQQIRLLNPATTADALPNNAIYHAGHLQKTASVSTKRFLDSYQLGLTRSTGLFDQLRPMPAGQTVEEAA